MNFNTFKKGTVLFASVFILSCIGYVHAGTNKFTCDSDTESPVQTLRNFFWVAMGFPGVDEYNCFTTGDTEEESAEIRKLVKQVGFIGEINALRTLVTTAIQATGVTSCESIPTTGTLTLPAGKTVEYGVASRLPPTNFPHTDVYDKKVTYTDGDRVADFEFHCGRSSMMVKISGDLPGGDPQTLVVFYDGEQTSTNKDKYVSFFIRDEGNFAPDFNMGVSLIVHDNGNYKMWMTRTGFNALGGANDEFTGYRFTATGNSNAKNLSIHYHDVSGSLRSDYDSIADIDSTDVASGVAPSAANQDPAKGCAPTYATQTSAITTNTLCAGLDLVEHPKNTFTAGSEMSMDWMQESFPTWISSL